MEKPDFFKLVKKELKDLLKKYDFKETYKQISNSSNCFLILKSKYCKMKIGKDKGDLFIHLSSLINAHTNKNNHNEFKEWYTLDEIIDFINGKYDFKENKKAFDDFSDTNIENEIKKIKLTLNNYFDEIIRLFNIDNFQKIKFKLNQFTQERSKAIMDLFT